VGAPWFRALEVAAYLNALKMAGVRFVPRRFRPTAAPYKGEECQGLDIQIVNRAVFDSVRMGFELLSATMRFHSGKFEPAAHLLGSDEVPAKLKAGESGRQILGGGPQSARTVPAHPGKVPAIRVSYVPAS
jgi:uncharacterized protein YbbC (DUF1343 family)